MATPVLEKVPLSSGSQYHLDWLDKIPPSGVATFAQEPPPLGQFLPMELLVEIWTMAGGLEARRVWRNTILSPAPSGGVALTTCGTRAPPPLTWGITRATQTATRDAYEYIELKRYPTDAKGLVFSLLKDMVFIEPTYVFETDFVQFTDALEDAHALGKLRSIAIGNEIVALPSNKPQIWEESDTKRITDITLARKTLSRFDGLELIFVVHGLRPAAHKKSEPNTRLFDLVRKTEDHRDKRTRTELEAALIRDGAVPTIVFVEYKKIQESDDDDGEDE